MGKLIINRPDRYIGKVRKAKIFINGEQKSTVKNNSTAEVELENGIYKVKAGYGPLSGMSQEVELEINDSESKYELETISNAIYWSLYIICYVCGFIIGYGLVAGINSLLLIICLTIIVLCQIYSSKNTLKLKKIEE